MYDLFKAITTEFVGTFLLSFVTAAVLSLSIPNGNTVVGSALCIGLVYISLIYVWNSFSGANFNPLITLSLAFAGRLSWCRALLYLIVQFIGAIAGAALAGWIYGNQSDEIPVSHVVDSEPWKVVVLEIILSFMLAVTFLFMTRNPMVSIVSAFVIGIVLIADILVGGYLATVFVNPATALGFGVFNGQLANYWVVIVGAIIGALLAALVYKLFTMPWTCAEIANKGCDSSCGEPVFYEEWKDCGDAHMTLKNHKHVEEVKEFVVQPELIVERPMKGRRNYKYTQL